MHYFCEKCHMLNEQDYCSVCGKSNLRSVDNRDYCFLMEADSFFGEMLLGILEEEAIPHSAVPSGTGIRSQFALKLENLKIYVAYEFFDKAKELLDYIFKNMEKANSTDLEKNIDRLFVSHRKEKKIKKAFKLAEEDSLVAYCSDKIINADRVENKGRISGCIKGGDYLFVYKDRDLIVINSATYEIISVEKKAGGKGG